MENEEDSQKQPIKDDSITPGSPPAYEPPKISSGLTSNPSKQQSTIFDRTVSIATVILLAASVVIYTFQARILKLQADISDRQAALSAEQKTISERQLELGTRPNLVVKPVMGSGGSVAKLDIINNGIFPVVALHVNTLYFVKILNHGWYVSVAGMNIQRNKLSPKEKWSIDAAVHAKILHDHHPFADEFKIQGNLEFVMFLIGFEREIDGHGYIYLAPMWLNNNGAFWSERDVAGSPLVDNISGPLSKVCLHTTELAFEYFRRRPLPRQYELYNYEYLLGYKPTGCIGPIEWVQ